MSPFTSKILSAANYYYFDIWQIQGDPRVNPYAFLNSGPWSTLAMIAAYLYFVKILGPELMKDRKPFQLRGLMVFYNFTMVAVSAWMFYEGSLLTNFGINVWGCQLIDYNSQDKSDLHLIKVGWVFFLTKFVEFADTVFFVLRKKNSQVSPLHVIHHSVVPLSVWIGMKFAPGGNNIFFPWLNAFVHTVMYLYYGLAALGPRVQPYLWWKKYLTKLQMAQFVLAIVHGMRAWFMPDCTFPKSFLFLNLFNAFLFLGLFYSFYRQSYIKRARERREEQRLVKSN